MSPRRSVCAPGEDRFLVPPSTPLRRDAMRLLQNLRHLDRFLGSGPRPTVRPRSRPLVLEALEDRLLMSVTVKFGTAEGQPAGQLTVTGDGASDTISLFAESQQIKVHRNGTLIRAVPDASVSAIQVNAGGGADTVRIASSLPARIISLTVDGGGDTY